MAAAEGTTMTVQAMGRLLGLKKTESYYLLHKHHFETVTINHQLRVVRASFEQWYAHQDKYRKVRKKPVRAAISGFNSFLYPSLCHSRIIRSVLWTMTE